MKTVKRILRFPLTLGAMALFVAAILLIGAPAFFYFAWKISAKPISNWLVE